MGESSLTYMLSMVPSYYETLTITPETEGTLNDLDRMINDLINDYDLSCHDWFNDIEENDPITFNREIPEFNFV